MKVIVKQIAWLNVERHYTHTLEIDPKEYALIQSGDHEYYEDIEEWAQDQELNGEFYDYGHEWQDDRIESVELEEAAE